MEIYLPLNERRTLWYDKREYGTRKPDRNWKTNMEKWYVEVKKADFDKIADRFHISPVVARLLRNRDMIKDEEIDLFLNGTEENLHSPFLMADMEKAVILMKEFIESGKKIRIIGDYDIDGVCSAFILQKGLGYAIENMSSMALKSEDKDIERELPDVVIPHRIQDGYGLNDRLIEQAGKDGVEVIITCDNGIAAANQIAYAKELGIHVIVTDHHEVPYEETEEGRKFMLPPADAVVDPKREDCGYPFKGICGGVVAYKFIQALFSVLYEDKKRPDEKERNKDEAQESPDGCSASAEEERKCEERRELLQECFAFAAFATVGDVMELAGENHIIVKYGLKAIASCKNAGMQALIEQCGLKDKELSPYHLGFVLGPCFNASGRLDSADRVLELLNAPTKREAMTIAAELKELNAERQDLTLKGLAEAVALAEKSGLIQDKVLVVYLPEVHESLAGIIAGKLREKYCRPVFVLTDGEEGIKGSGRSIDAYNMFEEMTKIKDIFSKYGGHKLAAGLSLPKGAAEEFRKRINEVCTLTEEDFVERVMIDVPMPIDYISEDLISQIKYLEPYGNGNRKPLFAQKGLLFEEPKVLGKSGNVVKGKLRSFSGRVFDGIYFGDGRQFLERLEKSRGMVDIVYTPEENTYRGTTTIQLEIKYIKFSGEEAV